MMNSENRIYNENDKMVSPLAARLWNSNASYAWEDVDILETPSEYIFSFEIAESLRDNVKIRVEDNKLYVSAKRGNTGSRTNIIESNGRYAEFKRNFRLPLPVDGNNVNAGFFDGDLIVVLPKTLEAKMSFINFN